MSIQRSRETQDCAFGRGIINQTGLPLERVDRVVEDDRWLLRRTLCHVRNGRFREIEEGVDVGVEGVEPLLRRKFGDLGNRILIPVIADEGVKLIAEVVQVLLNDRLTDIFFGQVGCKELELACVVRPLADEFRDILDVLFLSREIGDRQVCSLQG